MNYFNKKKQKNPHLNSIEMGIINIIDNLRYTQSYSIGPIVLSKREAHSINKLIAFL